MSQQDVESVIRGLWKEVEQHGGLANAAEFIDLQDRFGACGRVHKGLIQSNETGEQALRKVLDTLIGHHDDWRICCHEAGHAIVAVKLAIMLERIARGEGTKGVVEPFHDPDCNEPHDRASFQLFYAGGAASERLVFGTEARTFDYIADPLEDDKKKHRGLECRGRPNAFEADVDEAMLLLGGDKAKKTIEEVANLLGQRRDEDGKEGTITQEEVANFTGDTLW
jgi:hypothetical protein